MKTLESFIEINIRFSETDAMGVVWHGNYLKYFEDGREKFGLDYAMEYLDIYNQGYFTPIVNSNIDHKAPLFYGQKIRVKVILEFKQASKIMFKYEIVNLDTNELSAVGSTTQVFLNVESRKLELNKPEFYGNWESQQKWKVNE
jgi:acyl-CoA thioester hydrolase